MAEVVVWYSGGIHVLAAQRPGGAGLAEIFGGRMRSVAAVRSVYKSVYDK